MESANSLEDRLRDRLCDAAMLELAQRLIAIPSENPPGNHYEDCARTLLEELDKLGFSDVKREGACVVASVGTGSRTLYFSGHYDVVPAQSRDQFQPRVEGLNLFGRGSSDMKGGLAAMIHAAAAARDEGLLNNIVWNANRGAITLRATMRGQSAHVGRHFEGVNAFERAMPAIAKLLDLKKEVELRETQQQIAPAAARKSILLLGGRVEAGTNFNVTPDFCSFTIDRRINPEENLEEEERRLMDALEGCEVEVLQEEAAAATSAHESLGVVLSHHVTTVTGKAPAFEMCPGLLETRFYAARGIPAFSYGPGLLTVSHGPNEFIPIRNIGQCAVIYALTAAELLG